MTTTIATNAVYDETLAAAEEPAAPEQPFRALLAIVGERTSDGRLMQDFALRQPPLTLYGQLENLPGHDGAPIVGRIDYGIAEGDEMWAYGVLDAGSDVGVETIRLIRGGFLRGISVDAAAETVEYDEETQTAVFSGVEVGAATIVGFPAFRDTQIELLDELPAPSGEPVPIIAAGVVVSPLAPPPAAMFRNPNLDRRRGLHVEPDGRVWGHIYGWGECHIGSPEGRCVAVPRGSTSRGMFAGLDGRGVLTDDGETATTGPICLAADHAGLQASWVAAKDHYANTAVAVADVACGEDAYGIWVAGMVRPGTSPELVQALRASAPSGDWRPVGGRLELVAILAVNMPGFPALAARIEDGRVLALVASGGRPEGGCSCSTGGGDVEATVARQLAPVLKELRTLTAPARAEAASAIEADLLGSEAR